MSSGCGLNIKVRCGIHNPHLAEDLDGNNILGRLKSKERHYVNDVTKYNMTLVYIMSALKDEF